MKDEEGGEEEPDEKQQHHILWDRPKRSDLMMRVLNRDWGEGD